MSPFEHWKEEDGWVFASGMYGTMQWVKEGAGTVPQVPQKAEPEPAREEQETPVLEGKEGEEEKTTDGDVNDANIDKETPASAAKAEPFVPNDLPASEWGVSGNWRIPICIKPKTKPGASVPSNESPLFLGVQTMVMRPQIEANPK